MTNLDLLTQSPEWQAMQRENQEYEARLRASSFVVRHSAAFFVASGAVIFAALSIIGYFVFNGNALDYPELFGLAFVLTLTGIGLFVFTFSKICGYSTMKSMMIIISYFVVCGGLASLSGMFSGWLFG